jgi:hypothetical protein
MYRPDDIDTGGKYGPDLTEALPPEVMAHPLGRRRSKRLAIGTALALAIVGVGAGFAGGAAAASGQRPAGGVRILVPETQSGTNSFSGITTGGAPAMSAVPCPVPSGGKPTASSTASTRCSNGTGISTDPNAVGGTATATHLFNRTTTGGLTVRAYSQRFSEPTCLSSPIVTPTAETPICCGGVATSGAGARAARQASSMTVYTLDFSDSAAVGQGSLYNGATLAGPAAAKLVGAITTGEFGAVEGSPAWWVAAVVGRSVVDAQVTFDGGATDSMAPVGGVVSLAAEVGSKVADSKLGPWLVRGTLRLLGSGGSVLATIDLAASPAPIAIGQPMPPRSGVSTGVPVIGSGTNAPGAPRASTSPSGRATSSVGKGAALLPATVCALSAPSPPISSPPISSTGGATGASAGGATAAVGG